MNKEQILGRLLMNGHINIDELNILNKVIITIPKPSEGVIEGINKKFKEDQEKRLQEWIKIFDKNNTVKL